MPEKYKHNTIHITGASQEEEGRKETEIVFEEEIAENFPNLGKETVSQVMEVHKSPNTWYPRKTTPRHIMIKMAKIKDKDRVLKASIERKKIMYKGKPIRLSSGF